MPRLGSGLPSGQGAGGDHRPGRVAEVAALPEVDGLLREAERTRRAQPHLDDDEARPRRARVDRDQIELVATDMDVPGQDRPAVPVQAFRHERLGVVAGALRRGPGSRVGVAGHGGASQAALIGAGHPAITSATHRGRSSPPPRIAARSALAPAASPRSCGCPARQASPESTIDARFGRIRRRLLRSRSTTGGRDRRETSCDRCSFDTCCGRDHETSARRARAEGSSARFSIMATWERSGDRGRRRATESRRRLGAELQGGRTSAGLSLRAVGSAARVDHTGSGGSSAASRPTSGSRTSVRSRPWSVST